MVKYDIVPEKTALLVYDLQNDLVKAGALLENPEIREKLIPKLKILIDVCRSKGIPVIYARQGYRKDLSNQGIMAIIRPITSQLKALVRGTEGAEVYDEIKPQEGDIVIDKCRYSAFHGTELDLILRNKGVDTIIISGTSLQMGCGTTARDATVRDYKVIYPSDGTAAHDLRDMGWGPVPKEEVLRVELTILADGFAHVLSMDELISLLQ